MNEIVSNEYTNNHKALDIVSSDHTPSDIIALESGIAEEVVKNVRYTNHSSQGLATYGNYVKIKQTDGKSALYAHMKYGSININKGDFIEKGSIIGTMGNTGNAYGNHLHLEIKNQNNSNENPIISLNKQPDINNTSHTSTEDEKPNQEITTYNSQTQSNNEPIINNQTQDNIEQINNDEFLNNSNFNQKSIVDALKEINVDSSYQYREKLAIKNGIENYHGTYLQNIKLLNLLKEGNLKKA